MDSSSRARPRLANAAWVALLCLLFASSAFGQTCGDADGNGVVTLADGVQVLRAAAELSSSCADAVCDVDGSGSVTIVDGVRVLRAAAELPESLLCVADPFITSVQGERGTFGELVKLPGGMTAPPGAPTTVTDVQVGGAVAGRINTVTIEYDVAGVQAQGVAAESSLLVASANDASDPSPGSFALPLASDRGSATVGLALKPDLAVNQFTLKIASGSDGGVASQVVFVVIVVISEPPPTCGNRVLDPDESCDPPGSGCTAASGGGTCNTECACRFVDNGDGTVTDTTTSLQWEKKTGVWAVPIDCRVTGCPDPHDMNNNYQWCLDADDDRACDDPGNPPDGGIFTDFLARLNTDPCFAGHCDWRLPTVNRDGDPAELETIVDPTRPGCASGAGIPCIDPIFGPTAPEFYWSGTTNALGPNNA